MPRDYRLFLEDILESLENISADTKGMSFAEFSSDRKTRDAVIRNLEVICEAVKGIPEEVCAEYPGVAWKRIAGLRDILIHQYFAIDLEILWDIVLNKLPAVKDQISKMLKEVQE
jgi:uncharacterized protein with HEPN domain